MRIITYKQFQKINENRSPDFIKNFFELDEDGFIDEFKIWFGLEYETSNINLIYKGMPYIYDYMGYMYSGHSRVSEHTFNYYTLWIDNHPSWSQFPKRSQSLVCSTSIYNAGSYAEYYEGTNKGGGLYNVYPKKGSTIGVCPGPDIWVSFKYFREKLECDFNMNDFNYFIAEISNNKIANWNNLTKFLTSVTIGQISKFRETKLKIYPKGNEQTNLLLAIINIMQSTNKTLYNILEDLLDPKKNGFFIINDFNLIQNKNNKIFKRNSDYEVWFSDDALMNIVDDQAEYYSDDYEHEEYY